MKLSLRFALAPLATLAVACAMPVDPEPAPIEEPSSIHPAAELLHPGVFLAETALRSNPIPGVTAGTGGAKHPPYSAADAGN